MKILLLADNSKESTRALEAVRSGDWPTDSEFLVLGVTPRRFLPPPPPSMLEVLAGGWRERPSEDARVRVLVQLAVEALRSSGLVARGRARKGRWAKEVVAEARAWDADLVVVGSPDSAILVEMLLHGGGPSSVVANAPCSVEVIREKPAAHSRGAGLSTPRGRAPLLHTPG